MEKAGQDCVELNKLNGQRAGNGYGPNALSFAEIDSWAARTKRDPSIWELDALRALDHTWLQVGADLREKAKPPPTPKAK
jgi:hypothetical protein